MIHVTHDQTEAMTLGQRVAVMRSGSLMQVATPREVYECPANRFVAEFMGTPPMNLIPATIKGGQVVFTDGTVVPVPGRLADRVRDGQEVIFGIRPDDMTPIGDAGRCDVLRKSRFRQKFLGEDAQVLNKRQFTPSLDRGMRRENTFDECRTGARRADNEERLRSSRPMGRWPRPTRGARPCTSRRTTACCTRSRPT